MTTSYRDLFYFQIVSSTSPSTGQAKIIFFILDKGQVVSATSLVGIFAKLTMSRMSTVLGAEVGLRDMQF